MMMLKRIVLVVMCTVFVALFSINAHAEYRGSTEVVENPITIRVDETSQVVSFSLNADKSIIDESSAEVATPSNAEAAESGDGQVVTPSNAGTAEYGDVQVVTSSDAKMAGAGSGQVVMSSDAGIVAAADVQEVTSGGAETEEAGEVQIATPGNAQTASGD